MGEAGDAAARPFARVLARRRIRVELAVQPCLGRGRVGRRRLVLHRACAGAGASADGTGRPRRRLHHEAKAGGVTV
eukprot:scaffold12129_cov89-Isochrysis_galbana.AAC.4